MRRRFSFCLAIATFALLGSVTAARAIMPPRPGSDARLPEAARSLREQGFGKVSRPMVALPGTESILRSAPEAESAAAQISGVRYLPVLMGETADRPGTHAAGSLASELFGSWPTGSMTDYYKQVSYDQFQVTGTVYGWFRLAHNSSYYEGASGCNGLCGYPTSAGGFVRDVVQLADDGGMDWGQFDNDGPDGWPNSGDDDGYVDTVIIIHSGAGGECGGNNAIWSHSFFLRGWGVSAYTTQTASANGGYIRVDDYIIQPEISCFGGMIEVGVFCHEYGHALGLPDLYDTGGSGAGIGRWGLMSSGSWGGDGASPEQPVQMCAWSKVFLGWVTPTVVTYDDEFELPAVELAPSVLKVWTDGTPDSEYFLIENRQKELNDAQLPAAGLNIWHIDETVIDNGFASNEVNAGSRYGVALEQADGQNHLAVNQNRGDSGDPWPGSHLRRSFRGNTSPSSDDNTGANTSVSVTAIPDPALNATFNVAVGVTNPDTEGPEVTVLSPNGGEVWACGSGQTVQWAASDDVGVTAVDLHLSPDGGKTWPQLIAAGLSNTGSHSWQMPVTPASGMMVRVRARDARGNMGSDHSDGTFAGTDQYAPAVMLESPSGGELWSADTVESIMWVAADNVGVVGIDIFLSLDGGSTWSDTVAMGLPDSGKYDWTVLPRSTDQGRLSIRARDAAGLSGTDQSALFGLAAPTAVGAAPGRFALGPAVPNPFNPLTAIRFINPREGRVQMAVYDLLGRRVRTLLSESQPEGPGLVLWNGQDERGRGVSSGVYYVQAVAAGMRSYLKVTLLR